MNTAQIKVLTWGSALVLGAGLALYVGYYVKQRNVINQTVSKERMTKVLSSAPEIIKRAEDIVPYPMVEAAVIQYDWSAQPPAEKLEVEDAPPPPTPDSIQLAKLVKVLGVKMDARLEENSSAILRYLPQEMAARYQPTEQQMVGGVLKYVGETLDSPLDYARIVAVTPMGVEFGFSDQERAHEILEPPDYPLDGLVVVDGDNMVMVPIFKPIPGAEGFIPTPNRTSRISPDKFRLGAEDMLIFAEDYPRILAEDVRTTRHRDPKTGRYDGIELTQVSPTSIAASHGAQNGDVIKSINGHPVTSTQEAVNFVKNNKDMYDRWEVEVENRGRTRTVTYIPPRD